MPDDLTKLVRAHWREVYALLVAITRHPAMAEDLAQEVFLVAHRKQIRVGNGARLWLREVARRLAMNELRRKRPAPTAPEELERLIDSDAAHADEAVSDEFGERLAALRACLEDIPVPDRAILAARYENGIPLARIATDNQQSVGYIKQRLFRLRRRLAECVQRKTAHRTLTYANT
jgi:RNA polymerase sigma-70 factor (ECF subfamily)